MNLTSGRLTGANRAIAQCERANGASGEGPSAGLLIHCLRERNVAGSGPEWAPIGATRPSRGCIVLTLKFPAGPGCHQRLQGGAVPHQHLINPVHRLAGHLLDRRVRRRVMIGAAVVGGVNGTISGMTRIYVWSSPTGWSPSW